MEIREYKVDINKFVVIKDNDFEVILCDQGASIYAIKYDGHYMTHTPIDEHDFLGKKGYVGRTVGRTANRIEGDIITLENKEYKILKNEGENTLHGGVDGVSTKIFDYAIFSDDKLTKVIYHYLSKDLESGYPGNLDITITYTIKKDIPELLIEFNATTDKTTYCSLTNHAYYTVGEPSLYKTSLYIDASTYLNCRKLDLIPIDIKEVPDYLSFKRLKPITKDIENPNLMDSKARGYDHHYYFDNNDINSIKSSLVGETYQMDIYTDFKGMQIYSVNYPNTTPCYEIEPILHRSLAMEPQDGFLNNTILKPNETYNRFIRLSFKRK